MTTLADALTLAPRQLFIGGARRPAADGSTYSTLDPATGDPLAELASTTPTDALAALDAAAGAFPAWSDTTGEHRAHILGRALGLLRERAEAIAALLARDAGVTPGWAKAEVAAAAEAVRRAAEAARHMRANVGGRHRAGPWRQAAHALTTPAPGGDGAAADHAPNRGPGRARPPWDRGGEPPGPDVWRARRAPRPLGPTLIVLPNEEPLAVAARGVAGALAAGCSAVLKPAALAPLAPMAFAQVMIDAGLPRGVLNVIPCVNAPSVVEPVLGDPRLRKLVYAGDLATAQGLAELAAGGLPSIAWEIAGPAPFIVAEGADPDVAVAAAVAAATRCNGQAATAAHRVYAHRSLAQEIGDGLAAAFSALTVGDAAAGKAEIGPLLGPAVRDRALAWVEAATGGGARLLTGGGAPAGPGFFIQPTVLWDAAPPAGPTEAEPPGPVVGIVPFDGIDDAVTWANVSPHGVAAYVVAGEPGGAERIGARLSRGVVVVDAGRLPRLLGGRHDVRAFLRPQITVLPA
ncbi:MAG: aldehyde dehydrogenase family protein [Bifidobacteriaceae bacterium]|jgi:succinate-semialdehyde dehydrogenase/glutarate-semialdehyde dehydrogenase|nr:aldehyde dehydrogenase family protein [Bifidobacteriaceae bacterium]